MMTLRRWPIRRRLWVEAKHLLVVAGWIGFTIGIAIIARDVWYYAHYGADWFEAAALIDGDLIPYETGVDPGLPGWVFGTGFCIISAAVIALVTRLRSCPNRSGDGSLPHLS